MYKVAPFFARKRGNNMLSGEQLKFLRIYNGVTQKKVAEWCNISIRYVGMVENNEERLSEETYKAWINCIYGIGKPLSKEPRYNQTAKKKKLADKE